jgi:uncharacterized protein
MSLKRVWIDMVTAPDVPFFSSVVKEMQSRKCMEIVITARNCLEVPELVKKYGMHSVVYIDCFYGKMIISKIASFIIRSIQLSVFGLFQKVDVAFSFASRPQTVAAWLLRVPIVNMYDYEGGEIRVINILSSIVLVPQEFSRKLLKEIGLPPSKAVPYQGLKETAYAYDFIIDKKEVVESGINLSAINFILRMNSVFAHYHDHAKNFDIELIDYLTSFSEVNVIVLPRYQEQWHKVREMAQRKPRIVLLKRPVNGQNLIWHSDGVISGGGSMIREAVCLGVPSYDMFFGKIGAVERSLIESGKVVRLATNSDFSKITVQKQPQRKSVQRDDRLILYICDLIKDVTKAPVRTVLTHINAARQVAS